MAEINGITCCKEDKYCLFYVANFSDDLKKRLRNQFAIICHGEEYAGSGRIMYNYQSTVKSFLERYESKSASTKKGMIGELLIHLLLGAYFEEYKVVSPFFNMEEKSIKKGYDVVLTEVNNPTIWLTEVKSGELHKDKNSSQTMTDLINTAKDDLKNRLSEANETLWHEAINGAKIAFDSKNTMKEAVMDVLMSWGDKAYCGNNTSIDKNVILSGVVFADVKDKITLDVPAERQLNIEREGIFNKVYVIALQKETYDKVYQFIRDEATDETK